MRNRVLLLAVLLILLLGTVGAMWVVARRAQKRQAKPEIVFVFAHATEAQKLDPADADDPESVKVLNNVCEGLLRFKTGTNLVEGCLAETWNLSADGHTCIFALREGVKFHDGTPVTSEAVAWNFRRQMDPNAPAHFKSANFSGWSALYKDIESVRPLDETRLEIRSKSSNAAFLANMAMSPVYIISPKSFDLLGERIQQNPVGTGPFKFKDWQYNEKITLVANPDYWGTKPKLDRVVFKVVPDSAARLAQLQDFQGGVNAMDGLNLNDLPLVRNNPHLRLLEAPGLNLTYLAFNCRKPLMNNLEFRKAVALAIHKPALIDPVYRGAAVVATSALSPAVYGPQTNIVDWAPDLSQARTIIGKLEMTQKTITLSSTNLITGMIEHTETNVMERVELPPLRLYTVNVPRPYLPNPIKAAELIKADLAAIGVKLEIVALEPGAYQTAVAKAEHDLALAGCEGQNGDPDDLLAIVDPDLLKTSSSVNITFLQDDELAKAIDDGRQTFVLADRKKSYQLVLQLVHDRLPIIPLAHANDMVVLRANVRGFNLQPTGDIRLGTVFFK